MLAGLALEYRLKCYEQHVFFLKEENILQWCRWFSLYLKLIEGFNLLKIVQSSSCVFAIIKVVNYIDLSIEPDLNFFSLLNMSLHSS